jgi:predicted transcriptional regulator
MAKRRISAKQFVEDLRMGLDDAELMTKYNVSAVGLGRILDKLIEAELISMDELWSRSKVSETQVTKAFVEAQAAIDELAG